MAIALADLPGSGVVLAGLDALRELARGERDRFTVEALLVAVGARRLRAAGLAVPHVAHWPEQPELALYQAIADEQADAHTQYNALLRRLVSFERALEARNRRSGALVAAATPTVRTCGRRSHPANP